MSQLFQCLVEFDWSNLTALKSWFKALYGYILVQQYYVQVFQSQIRVVTTISVSSQIRPVKFDHPQKRFKTAQKVNVEPLYGYILVQQYYVQVFQSQIRLVTTISVSSQI